MEQRGLPLSYDSKRPDSLTVVTVVTVASEEYIG
jgi:hypothetical protein